VQHASSAPASFIFYEILLATLRRHQPSKVWPKPLLFGARYEIRWPQRDSRMRLERKPASPSLYMSLLRKAWSRPRTDPPADNPQMRGMIPSPALNVGGLGSRRRRVHLPLAQIRPEMWALGRGNLGQFTVPERTQSSRLRLSAASGISAGVETWPSG
jgi:hypothetical protein